MARHEFDGVTYVDAGEACELLCIKPATLYAYVSRGRLRSFKRGGRQRLYPLIDIQRALRLEPGRPTHIPLAEDWIGD